jgi:CheY-like chemotaxis protein
VRKEAARILIVDDADDARQTMAMLVSLWGYEVHQAPDGVTALRAAETFRPQVALLDLGMPRMTGWELAEGLLRRGAEPTVCIVISGYATERDRQRSREAGIAHHLAKPIDPELLERLLARVTSKCA